MHTIHAVLSFVVVLYQSIIDIYFKITLLALMQSYKCSRDSETILDDMGKWIT